MHLNLYCGLVIVVGRWRKGCWGWPAQIRYFSREQLRDASRAWTCAKAIARPTNTTARELLGNEVFTDTVFVFFSVSLSVPSFPCSLFRLFAVIVCGCAGTSGCTIRDVQNPGPQNAEQQRHNHIWGRRLGSPTMTIGLGL